MMLQGRADPFFSNDPAGYVRVLFAFVLGMSPIFGLVIWFLRRGPDERITRVESDVTGLGEKVDDMGKDMARDRAERQTLQREIAENQREVIDMLTTSAKAIQSDINSLAIKVAVLSERSDIADCFEKFGTRIENAVIRVASQRGT